MLAATAGPDIYNRLYGEEPDVSVLDTPEVRKAIDIVRVFSSRRPRGREPAVERDHQYRDLRAGFVPHQGDWMKGEWIAAGKVPGVDFGCAVIPGSRPWR